VEQVVVVVAAKIAVQDFAQFVVAKRKQCTK
jgi:hypothetical protein